MLARRVLRRIADKGGIAAGAAILPDNLIIVKGRDEPALPDHMALPWPVGRRSASVISMAAASGVRRLPMLMSRNLKQIVRRRTERAGARQCRNVPVCHRRETGVVTARQTLPASNATA